MKSISEIVEYCVERINTAERPVYFMFGNWIELCNDLTMKGSTPSLRNRKYPVVLLHNDYSETISGINKFVTARNVKLYIICQSDNKLTTEQRKSQVYDSVLTPICDDLVTEFHKGKNLAKTYARIEYEKKDLYRLYVGDNQNRLPDFLDAIELTFNTLSYKPFNN